MSLEPPADATPLGHGHHISSVTDGQGRRVGVHEWHRRPDDGRWCVGYVAFHREEAGAPVWTVEAEDPLTVSPSVLCSCGEHGFIRDGRWVPA